MCLSLCVYVHLSVVPMKARRCCQIFWSWSYRWLWTTHCECWEPNLCSFFNFVNFIELYIFLCSPPCLSPPLKPFCMIPMLPIYSDLVFFYFPCRLDLFKFVLVSSLLFKFSGIVVFRLAFFALCLKTTYEWVHLIIVFDNALNLSNSKPVDEKYSLKYWQKISMNTWTNLQPWTSRLHPRDIGIFQYMEIR